MSLISLWIYFIISYVGKSGARLEVKECQNKVCTNVNLSDSVVILRPEEIQGKSLVHFKDSVTHYNLVDLFWEKNSKKVSFGLVTGSSQSIGNVIEYDSMPSNGNEDNSYDCSIAFHDEHLKVFIDGIPSAAWNLSSLEAISDENKTKMSEKINLDFTSISLSDLSEGIFISDRCLEGYHINITDQRCLSCPTNETSYGTGMTKICTDFEKMVEFCGSTVCSAYCPKLVTETPYGEFTWPATLVSSTPQELPCKYDDNHSKARRICSANNTWSEVDTSECVNTKLTEQLQQILDSGTNTELTAHNLVQLQHLEESSDLGNKDILLIYDIINKITGRGQGLVSYKYGSAIVDTLTYVSTSQICSNNPTCYWLVELVREALPRLENKTVLILSDNAGMFYLEDQMSILDVYKFCRNTFHDMITGCQNDRLSFLKVMKNELERLLDGSKRNNVTLSIVFLNSNAFFPAAEVLSATQFNETLQRYKNHGVQSEEKEMQTIATMVVDLAVNGLSNSTETNVWFDLYKNAVHKSDDRLFQAKLNGSTVTYKIDYVCVRYTTNSTRNGYLAEKGIVWEGDKSKISSEGAVDLTEILQNKTRAGVWSTEGCETVYDKMSNDPTIRCTCSGTSGAFTVLARILRHDFPKYYMEILISLTGICVLGIAMGILIIFIPAKWMGIPKAAKINLAVVMLLLLVALYFMVRKMVSEFGKFEF